MAQYAARLFDAYPGATPNMVRALLCHFARSVQAPELVGIEPHYLRGFGQPNLDAALYSDGSATFLFQGSLTAASYRFLPFHIPQAVVGDDASRLTIRGTVVFDPPVSPDDSVNYSLSRLSYLLRKRRESDYVDVPLGGEDAVVQPWNPLFHFSKNFKRGHASGEWELRLRLMKRGNLPSDFSQTFASVIQVVDQSGRIDVRDAVASEFGDVYETVQLRIAA